jgi:hypothetical protein
MIGGSLVVLPLIAVLAATVYRRSRPAGSPPRSWREGVVFGLTFFGTAFIGMGLAAFGQTKAPVSPTDWCAVIVALVVMGCTPLGVFLLLDTALRLTRRWEEAERLRVKPVTRKRSDDLDF